VTTIAADNVTAAGATLHGDIIPNELPTTGWFEWGSDANLTTFDSTQVRDMGSGKTSVPISQTLSPLAVGATYYYRVAAQNTVGPPSRGEILSFSTVPQPPSVSTAAASSVTFDNAVLEGGANPNGLPTTAGFDYGTDNTMVVFTTTPPQNIGSGTTEIPLVAPVTSLTGATRYYFRVSATNPVGTTKGNVVQFDTIAVAPTAFTTASTSVTNDSALLNGTVNPNGQETTAWFEWGISPTLATYTPTPGQSIGAGTSAQSVNAPIASLTGGTTYYFRVAAVNGTGTSKGAIRNFTTLRLPAVTTGSATSITTSGADLHGDVNPNGLATEAWFEYGTDPGLSSPLSTASVPVGSGTAAVSTSASVSGLTPWTTYYFRVVARNSAGTQEGALHSFPTGEYYVAVGDSITDGSQDDDVTDGIGFEPILRDLLTAAKGYPHTVASEGVSGATSAGGAALISTTLSNHPSAKYFLILYGTNDADTANGPVSKASYKTNIQSIITAIKNAGKVPYLSKVPFVDSMNPSFPAGANFSDAAIRLYNEAIDELRVSNNILVVAPNFYTWFQAHPEELADGIHPNGLGYDSMVTSPNMWLDVLP
jgi:lysophospholipase L1-like esterase